MVLRLGNTTTGISCCEAAAGICARRTGRAVKAKAVSLQVWASSLPQPGRTSRTRLSGAVCCQTSSHCKAGSSASKRSLSSAPGARSTSSCNVAPRRVLVCCQIDERDESGECGECSGKGGEKL